MRTPASAYDVRPPSITEDRPQRRPQTVPHPHHHTCSLAGGGKGRAGQGCPSRRVGKGPPGHARHLVPPNGDLHQEERVTQEDHKLPTPQPTRHPGDPPLPVTFPPGQSYPTTDEENDLRRMERLSLRGPSRGGQALHYFYYTLGTVPLPHSPARLHRLRRCLHGAVRRPHHQCIQQNQVHRRCPAVGG